MQFWGHPPKPLLYVSESRTGLVGAHFDMTGGEQTRGGNAPWAGGPKIFLERGLLVCFAPLSFSPVLPLSDHISYRIHCLLCRFHFFWQEQVPHWNRVGVWFFFPSLVNANSSPANLKNRVGRCTSIGKFRWGLSWRISRNIQMSVFFRPQF